MSALYSRGFCPSRFSNGGYTDAPARACGRASSLLALPLAAQFEGTISMKVSAGAGDMMMTMSLKGDQQSTVMTLPASAGPMAGMEARTIFDRKDEYHDHAVAAAAWTGADSGARQRQGHQDGASICRRTSAMRRRPQAQIKKLGTSQQNRRLRLRRLRSHPGERKANAGMYRRVAGSLRISADRRWNGRSRERTRTAPAWTTAFGGKPAFPLKVSQSDGTVVMEVLSVDKAPVSASVFEIPEDTSICASLFRRGGTLTLGRSTASSRRNVSATPSR